MPAVQDIFFKIQDAKKRKREIRTLYRDALKHSSAYSGILDQIAQLQEKKRAIEEKVKSEFSKELDMLDQISHELKDEHERMADLVLAGLLKGEIIKVHDMKNYVYDPVVKVTFKKSDDQPTTVL